MEAITLKEQFKISIKEMDKIYKQQEKEMAVTTAITIDDKINELFVVLSKQQAEVDAAEADSKKPWKTKCSFMLNVVSTNINIQTANASLLIEIQAELSLKEAFFGKAAEDLGLTWDGKWDGFSVEDWHSDLIKRAAIININAKKAKLAELEKKLNAIVSPDQRRQIELANIIASLEV